MYRDLSLEMSADSYQNLFIFLSEISTFNYLAT